MSVHEMRVFFATCDECPWISEKPWPVLRSEAEDLLDRHIATNH